MASYRQSLRHQSRGDWQIDTGNFNAAMDTVGALGRVSDDPAEYAVVRRMGSHIERVPRRRLFTPETKVAFGYAISGNTVVVNSGLFIWHGRGASYQRVVAETTVTVTGGSAASPHYVYLLYVWATNAASVVYHASATLPVSNSTSLKWLLYSAYLSGTTAVIPADGIHQRGSVQIVSAI